MRNLARPVLTAAMALLAVGCGSEVSGTIVPDPTTSTSTDTTLTDTTLTLTDTTDGGGGSGPCESVKVPYSETQELVTVPATATYMQVKAWGAGGNQEGGCAPPEDDAGIGGFTGAVFAVTPGQQFLVIVGQRGRADTTGEDIVRFGFGHWGGGGLSGVFTGGPLITENDFDRALVIAGGGGGASAPGCNPAGTGNHPDTEVDANMMATMMGGAGADDVNGGAGGYLGGKGGLAGLPGGGGRGFVHDSAVDFVKESVEPGAAAPPRTDDPDYNGTAGGIESPGLVVLSFVCSIPPPL